MHPLLHFTNLSALFFANTRPFRNMPSQNRDFSRQMLKGGLRLVRTSIRKLLFFFYRHASFFQMVIQSCGELINSILVMCQVIRYEYSRGLDNFLAFDTLASWGKLILVGNCSKLTVSHLEWRIGSFLQSRLYWRPFSKACSWRSDGIVHIAIRQWICALKMVQFHSRRARPKCRICRSVIFRAFTFRFEVHNVSIRMSALYCWYLWILSAVRNSVLSLKLNTPHTSIT